MFFRKKEKKDELIKLYELFLNNIDTLSQIRLRGYDISFNNLKEKLKGDNLVLTEISCIGNEIFIKRNKDGFYLVKSGNSDIDKKNLKMLNKHKLDFENIHALLLDKEWIMSGNYYCNKKHQDDLKTISNYLGYGDKRDKILNEK